MAKLEEVRQLALIFTGDYFNTGLGAFLDLARMEALQKDLTAAIESNRGICEHLSDRFPNLLLMEQWEHHSGSYAYPVPAPDSFMAPSEAFRYLRKWKGDYGALRKDLLQFCIDYLKEALQ